MGDSLNTKDAVSKSNNDAVVEGNPDDMKLICKFASKSLGIAKSTKAYQTGAGVVMQFSTKEGDSVAEAVVYVPGAKIEGKEGNYKVV